MREAVGGALLLKIMIVFIVVYIAFLAIAVNYSQAFRVKNQIINIVEQYEGYEFGSGAAYEEILIFLNRVRYTGRFDEGTVTAVNTDRGTYYRVTTYINFEFPIVGDFLEFPIRGETKIIY